MPIAFLQDDNSVRNRKCPTFQLHGWNSGISIQPVAARRERFYQQNCLWLVTQAAERYSVKDTLDEEFRDFYTAGCGESRAVFPANTAGSLLAQAAERYSVKDTRRGIPGFLYSQLPRIASGLSSRHRRFTTSAGCREVLCQRH